MLHSRPDPNRRFGSAIGQFTSAWTPLWSELQQIASGDGPQLGANGFGTSAKRRVSMPSPSVSPAPSGAPAQSDAAVAGTSQM
jgi:hypothetical protein